MKNLSAETISQLPTFAQYTTLAPVAVRERLAIVGGCGHVGLPLGMTFARRGHQVDLLDLSTERVSVVNKGQMPFKERGAADVLPLLLQRGRLQATTDPTILAHASTVIVTIGTPVGDYLDPQVSPFLRAMQQLVPQLAPGCMLVLRSTLAPGVTGATQRLLNDMGRTDIDLAFCPERILQEQSLEELAKLPQIVSAFSGHAQERAAELFRNISPKIIFLEPVEAELAKLFCNAYRYIQFATANQFYLLAQKHGADFTRIYNAVKDDYPRMGGLSKPGLAAGPCLVKDTVQLTGYDKTSFPLGQAAIAVNESMPSMMVELAKRRHDLKTMTAGVLGMAFKQNNDDPRDSLSYKLKKVLKMECAGVLCTDPYVRDDTLVSLDRVTQEADIIFVGTPHDVYRSLRFRQPVIDITDVLSHATAGEAIAA